MFTTADFAHLRFLEGRWEGIAPDGSPFYEQYRFAGDDEMRANRYADARFDEAEDGSEVVLRDGRVLSSWSGFSWEAAELTDGRACFVPVNAPSAFCWERASESEVRVTQRWTDEQGKPQQYVVSLRRL